MELATVVLSGPVLQSALRKARWRLIPLLFCGYLVAFMDRANISFAAETMNRDLHFTPKMYGFGAGIFFVSYALFEIPSSQLLLRFGARRWIARIMMTWGLLAAAMVLIRTPASFYSMRLLLGFAEAGFFPAAVFYISQWFPVGERSRAIGLFYMALPISSVVMGGLSGALLRQNGRLGLAGWQWLFLVEAIPAILLSIVVWFCLTDSPATARWLSLEEREAIVLEMEKQPARRTGGDCRSGLRVALGSGQAWMIGLYGSLLVGPAYAVIFSLPLILQGLTQWDATHVGYLIAGFGVGGGVAMVLNATHSDRKRELKWHLVLPTSVMAGGCLLAGVHLAGWSAVLLLFVILTFFYATQGPGASLPGRIFSGEAEAVAIAMMTMGSIAGGFVGPYWMGWMREATGGYAVGVGGLFVPLVLAAFCVLVLVRHMETGLVAEKGIDERSGGSSVCAG